MKQVLTASLAALVAIAAASVGASLRAQDQQPGKEPKHIAYDYYPLKEKGRWTYLATDNKAKEPGKKEHVVTTVAGKELFPIKVKTKDLGDTKEMYVGYKLQVAGGGKVLDEEVLVKEDGVYRISGAGKTIAPPLCFLKAGLKKGETWTVDSQSENAVLKGRFVYDEETVQVPAGTFNAIVVRTDDFQIGGQTMQIDAWYAPKVGMVKQRVRVGQHDVTLELERFEAAP